MQTNSIKRRLTEDIKELGRPMVLTAQCPAMLDRVNFMLCYVMKDVKINNDIVK